MPLLDLTLSIAAQELQRDRHDAPHVMRATQERLDYRAMGPGEDRSRVACVYRFGHWSMSGTYLDLPGHLELTDDGRDMANVPAQELFRIPATLFRINPESHSGAVTEDHLKTCSSKLQPGGAAVVHALGNKRHDEIPFRSVWLTAGAVEWLIDQRFSLVVSDIYESCSDFQDVFKRFFAAGVSTVCAPDHLHPLQPEQLRITALPLRFEGVTQAPCRLLAEWADESKAAAVGWG